MPKAHMHNNVNVSSLYDATRALWGSTTKWDGIEEYRDTENQYAPDSLIWSQEHSSIIGSDKLQTVPQRREIINLSGKFLY